MEDERQEDLNPSTDAIEEKIKRMLDPSVPDEPESNEIPVSIVSKPSAKNINIQSVSAPVAKPAADLSTGDTPSAPSAPELPQPATDTKQPVKVASKSKKVIIPISHDANEPAAETTQKATKDEKKSVPTAISVNPIEDVPALPDAEAAEVTQITITEHSGESPDDLAQELDQAIAGLDTKKSKPKAKTKKPATKLKVVDATEAENAATNESNDEQAVGDEAEAVLVDAEESLDEADTEEQPDDQVAEELGPKIQVAQSAPKIIPKAPSKTEPVEDKPLPESRVINDLATDKAVEDIVATEGDELLEIEDAVRETDAPVKVAPEKRRNPLKILVKPAVVKLFALLLLAGIVGALIFPVSRYFVLNTAGVRANSSVQVLDDSTQQPLKNATVTIGNVTATTDDSGTARLQRVKLGPSSLTVEKRAFSPINKSVTIGWGSNPLGDFRLVPTGTQYSFAVTDFLTGKPIAGVEASTNDASAISNDKGIIKLTVDKPGESAFDVQIKGDGLRTETVQVKPSDKSTHGLKLVPGRKQFYVSKRSGKYDIYGIYIDGKSEKLLLAGSGSERDDSVLVPHPSASTLAYVSTRPGQHTSSGALLSSLVLINTEDGTTTNVNSSERIQMVGWQGDYLIYTQIASGASANSPQRYRLISYNYKDQSSKELASANYFNDVQAVGSSIYYAPSSAYQSAKTTFNKINPDGTSQQVIFDQEVWNIFRSGYDHLILSVQQLWYDYKIGDKAPTKLNSAPADQNTHTYTESPDGKHSAWVDNRDGKGVLIAYDTAAKTDATLTTQSGLTYPVTWLSNTVVVYRIKTAQETADYAISINGGNPVKIHDVTNTAGIGSSSTL